MKDEAKQLNSLFEKIYQDASPDVRRAMNKSFTESGMKIMKSDEKTLRDIYRLAQMNHSYFPFEV